MSGSTSPKKGNVLVLVGTRKGAFIFSSSSDRAEWELSGPYWPGSDIFHVVYDGRGDGCMYVVENNPIFGAQIHISRDFGTTWTSPQKGPQIGSTSGFNLNRLWQVTPGPEKQPDVVYAGGEPACLFKSDDSGDTWHEIESISKHPTRERWESGMGGMNLHSIVPDASSDSRMWVGISAAGVFRTEDGGESWQPMNKGVRADFMGVPFPEIGQCPHRMVSPNDGSQTLYQQNHCGVYRSDNGGNDWIDISDGLPSRFGLAATEHPSDPDTFYVLPEDKVVGEDLGGGIRYVTDAKMRVYRSRDRGRTWKALTKGLPQENAYLHAMRDGMATDRMNPCGIYVGTSTGQLYHSRNEGDNWQLLADLLPPINSVETGTVV